jgi:drug/metabolite transporter (DMT)-like permease
MFGALSIAVRRGLIRGGDPEVGALITTAGGSLTALVLAIPSLVGGIDFGQLWHFYLIGLFVPGVSQIVFILSVRHAGAARASLVIGVAPLISVGLALLFLDEPFQWPLIVATALIVLGGVALAGEGRRPEHFRMLGVFLALICTVLFGIRDNLVRWVAVDGDPPVLEATAISLLGATTTVLTYLLIVRRERLRTNAAHTLRAFAPAGVALGLAYSCLVIGFDQGRVGVVAPLNATQSMFGVLLAGLAFHDEHVNRRTIAAGLLVVAGGALIGAVR